MIAKVAGKPKVAVIIPAFNEEQALPSVLRAIPRALVEEIVVVDNGSCDNTSRVAQANGATIVYEPRRGYGQACLSGIGHCKSAQILVFLDADFSDYPEELPLLLAPLLEQTADLVIGSRTLAGKGKEVLLPQAYYGNRLACFLMRCLFGANYTDLGPFRAITQTALAKLAMRDRNFGWTVEMQVKAKRRGLRVAEVAVRYRQRIGQSKITGTFLGTLRAGYKILFTIFKLRVLNR